MNPINTWAIWTIYTQSKSETSFHKKAIDSRTIKLGKTLAIYQSDSDPAFITTLIGSIFAPYLRTYPQIEQRFINDQCAAILSRYYDSKAHQKRQISSGGLQDFKRDIQARLLNVENYGGETFLSEEVAINILQEIKNAFSRCNLVRTP
jgi:recyclin-1